MHSKRNKGNRSVNKHKYTTNNNKNHYSLVFKIIIKYQQKKKTQENLDMYWQTGLFIFN